MPEFDIILTTIDNYTQAKIIASSLLDDNLAPCIQIEKIQSFFKWENIITEREEFRIMIKAKRNNYQKIESKILAIHNDENPQIIKINISGGSSMYLEWLNNN